MNPTRATLTAAAPKRIIGRIPPKRVTMEYLDRLVDLCCTRHKRSVTADAAEGHAALKRYVAARRLLRDEIERYATQGTRERFKQRLEGRDG